MAASHTIVGVLGTVVSLALAVSMSVTTPTLGADGADAPYAGLWIYTPYVDAGGRVSVKIFLQGGDGIVVDNLRASVDGAPVAVEGRENKERRPSKRFDMGKLDIELRAVVPDGVAAGDHSLAFDMETTCRGSSFSKACGKVHLEAPIGVGGTTLAKLLAALRAIGAALVVAWLFRRGWDPMKRWVNGSGKSGAMLTPAFIVVLVLWAWGSYPLFARPLGAALGSSSDVLYGIAIVAWLAVWPVAVRTRHRFLRQPS